MKNTRILFFYLMFLFNFSIKVILEELIHIK